jgi:hypothetical protein
VSAASRKTAAWLGLSGLLSIGMATACTVPSTALSCTAAPSLSSPVHNAVETITVKTVAGAITTARAAFRTGPVSLTTLANAHGAASFVYRLGAATTANFPVKVTVNVAKGGRKGSCSTVFTPTGASLPAAPVVSLTTSSDGVIGLSWSDPAAAITGYRATIDSDAGPILSKVFPAGSTGTSASFGRPLSNACAPASAKDHVTATVIALSAAGNSAAGTASREMPRTSPPTPSAPVFTVAGPTVNFDVPTDCPVIVVHDADGNSLLSADHTLTVSNGGNYQFSYYFCSNSGQITQEFLSSYCGSAGPLSASVLLGTPPPPPWNISGLCFGAGTEINWVYGVEPGDANSKPVSTIHFEPTDGFTGEGDEPFNSDYVFESRPADGVSAVAGTHTVTMWTVAPDGSTSAHVPQSTICS